MTDYATCRRSEETVVTGNMTGHAAYRRAFDATLGVGRSSGECDYQRQYGGAKNRFHRSNSLSLF